MNDQGSSDGLNLLHLLLVGLDKAVTELGGKAGRLFQEMVAVQVGRDSNLFGKACHLPNLQRIVTMQILQKK